MLKGIDLQVAPRELVFVIGPSGSGKSTLLRCCNRLEEPTSGSVRVDGTDICAPGVDLNRVRQKIGFVFQSFNLYPHMNALGNVTLALRKVQRLSRADAEGKGRAALARVGLAEKAPAYPNELSGGQQQRVAIARALALEPSMLMFDEPTSALDPELVGSVLQVMRELRESGMTMLVVSHELSFARAAADRVDVHGPRPDRRAGRAGEDLRRRRQPARARVRRVDLRASLIEGRSAMLKLKPNCECCNRDLPPDSREAMMCSFECTFCRTCAETVLHGVCPNCGGELVRRPIRPAAKLAKFPASTERVYKPEGCGRVALGRYGAAVVRLADCRSP